MVLDGTQLPPGRGHSGPPLFDACLLWPDGRPWVSATAEFLLYNGKINMTYEETLKQHIKK